MKQLHILNGQGTAYNFELEGDYLIWNEALACGPTHYQVASDEFHVVRKQFFRQYDALPLRESLQFSEKEYQRIATQEMDKLPTAANYDEITLWFELDWFCQINMMAVLSWFWQSQTALDRLYLVCIGDHPEVDDFRGLGQLKPEHFAPLFQIRQKLTLDDIAFADKVWASYCGEDMLVLTELVENYQRDAFPYLPKAFEFFQQLFPNSQTGLNIIEQQMLTMVHEQELKNRHQWVGQMLRQSDPYLGFGDLQYYDSMQRMQALWQENGQVKLTDLGQQVLGNELKHQPTSFALGGVQNIDYRWDAEDQRLKKV